MLLTRTETSSPCKGSERSILQPRYFEEINLLADAIRNSKKPDMVLSIMPGDGAVPASGQAIATAGSATAYRITPDFHADKGAAGGICRNPAGCWGSPGAEIVVGKCSATDKSQVWESEGTSSFAMTFSAGPMLLSCRHDTSHNCLAVRPLSAEPSRVCKR